MKASAAASRGFTRSIPSSPGTAGTVPLLPRVPRGRNRPENFTQINASTKRPGNGLVSRKTNPAYKISSQYGEKSMPFPAANVRFTLLPACDTGTGKLMGGSEPGERIHFRREPCGDRLAPGGGRQGYREADGRILRIHEKVGGPGSGRGTAGTEKRGPLQEPLPPGGVQAAGVVETGPGPGRRPFSPANSPI